ncbi:hypothetical protein V8B55DRAFT_1486730 [Mucor lusitanicus]|uniref:Ricin B lectin domain-containing protein n=1 Tax=Mucor circinelloides f. lusitanicus TaxID=29924 RepID=A0A8H4B7P5_MUCCL|nr:hypothetical protein FB192DRAFT_1402821 [Mucor lusitanicus]
MSNTSMFPEGLFYILSRKHGFALDVYDGQTKEGANLIVWPQKFQDSDNQLWSFDGGRLTNKKSGHVMDISSSAFKSDKTIVQKKRKASKQSQEWIYDQGFICSKEYPSLVLDIRGDSPKGGAQVLLYKRKDTDNLNQLWQFEPYQQFENALNMATTSIPLHKKEGFGQPRPGYAAEPGVPPELKQVPENNKIAGVGNNVAPTSTTTAAGNSRADPVLANYGSFYGGTTTAPPAAQPGQAPSSSGNYPPPPPPPRNDNYPPPSAQPGQAPSPSSFPEPIPANATSSFSPPPPPPASTAAGGGYPPASGYPPAPQSPSNYPPAPQSPPSYPPQHASSGYPPPSSPSNYNSYPGSQHHQQPSGYPPAPGNMSTSPPNYPSYPPPSNANAGYPPSPSAGGPGFPQPNAPQEHFYHQQQPTGMPGHGGHANQGYPPPPPLPGNRPNNNSDQYGYPSYPQ